MRERELSTLYVNFEHLAEWDMVRHACPPPAPAGRAGCRTAVASTGARGLALRTHGRALPCSAPPPPTCPSVHERAQDLATNIVEALYPLEPFLRSGVREFVRSHLDTYAEREDGADKEFWVSFYNLEASTPGRALAPALRAARRRPAPARVLAPVPSLPVL